MTKIDFMQKHTSALRQQAEKQLKKRSADQDTIPLESAQGLLHELQVQQIELEMQNEELHRAQEKLEISRTKYFDLFDLAPVGYLALNEKGLILEANLTASQMLGVERSTLVNHPLAHFILRDDQDIYYLHHKRLFETGETQVCELRMSSKDGSPFWARIEATVDKDYMSGPTVYRAVISDITESKRKELKIIQLAAIVQSSEDAIISKSLDGIIFSWNKSAEKIYGYTESEIVGKPISILIPHGRTDEVSQILEKIKSGVHIEHYETIRRKKDGQDVHVSLTVSPIRDTEGRIVAVSTIGRDSTERNQSEELIRYQQAIIQSSEEKYHLIVENANEAIFIAQDAIIRFCNLKTMELLEVSQEEILTSSFINFIHPEDRDMILECHRRRMQGEVLPAVYSFRIINKAGNIKWVEINAVAITWEGWPATLNFLSDITARKQVEAELLMSESRYRTLVENVNDVLFSADMQGVMTYISPAVERISHYTASELVGKPFINFIHPDDLPAIISRFVKLLAGEITPAVYRFVDKDGSIIHVRTFSSPVYEEGRPVGITGVITDITDQKKAEDALLKSEEKYRSILNNMQEGYYEIDLLGNFTFINESFTTILGYMADEILGSSYTRYMDKDTAGQIYEDFHRVFQTGQPDKGIDWLFICKDGTKKSLGVSIGLIKDGVGRPVGFRGVMRDISKRKALECSLIEKNTSLEEMRARLEIFNKELLKANKDLKDAQAQVVQSEKMASIGQLAAGVAHEINNPVGFITSNLNTLGKYSQWITEYLKYQDDLLASYGQDSSKDLIEKRKSLKIDYIIKDINDLITESLDGTDRVKKIVVDLKSFSRRDEPELVYSDINTCIESTLTVVWNELKYKAEVKKELGDIPKLRCFPQQLSQVFMNLFVNAAHAIDNRGEITIKTWESDGYIHISIADTGCGITPEQKEKIFEPFFTTKEAGKGTGLGLSISLDIIMKHKGAIRVESAIGSGTTFIVDLPLEVDISSMSGQLGAAIG
jgi:PAS domain S-box-containing protein